MPVWFSNMPRVQQALAATIGTWGATALGAALIFCFRSVKKSLMNGLMSFAGGVMIAASFFSLLLPALEMSSPLYVCTGFLLGSGFILGCDWLCENKLPVQYARNRRQTILMTSITLHNIPEGFAVGVAFGALDNVIQSAEWSAAWALAAGIACQNLPEGFAVSAPLMREGANRGKAFFMGQLSGMVEIAAGVTGALLVQQVQVLLPWLLSFAAGAMVCVVVAELIPESRNDGKKASVTLWCMAGFAVMMLLDTVLG